MQGKEDDEKILEVCETVSAGIYYRTANDDRGGHWRSGSAEAYGKYY